MGAGGDYGTYSYFLGVSGILGVLTTFSLTGVSTFWGVVLAGELLSIFKTGLSLCSVWGSPYIWKVKIYKPTKTLHKLINWSAERGMLLAYSSDMPGESAGHTTFLVTFLDLLGTFFEEVYYLSSVSS